jgi:glycosyltransferase involved in cell wall biosynthesis
VKKNPPARCKLLTSQPFSVNAAGGGPRILRRLLEPAGDQAISLVANYFPGPLPEGPLIEQSVFINPLMRPWHRSVLRTFFSFFRQNFFHAFNSRKILNAAKRIDCDIVHLVGHGSLTGALLDEEYLTNRSLWVSFHDHFESVSSFKDVERLWKRADRRFVISAAMGDHYSEIFGGRDWEVVTDGVGESDLAAPKKSNPAKTIYFFGSIHIGYLQLFEVLADALDELQKKGINLKLVLRGGHPIKPLKKRNFEIEYRPHTLGDRELKNDLEEADILYFPMKFSDPHFFKYSMSTKMIGYLAAPGAILYHGPLHSAAARLLAESDAAMLVESLNPRDLVEQIPLLETMGLELSKNAKHLARTHFSLSENRSRFWRGTEFAAVPMSENI